VVDPAIRTDLAAPVDAAADGPVIEAVNLALRLRVLAPLVDRMALIRSLISG
jgi:hypothetical protein